MKNIYIPDNVKNSYEEIANKNYKGYILKDLKPYITEAELENPDLIFNREGTRFIKESRNALSEIKLGDGKSYIFKKFSNRGLINRIKNTFRTSKGVKGLNKAFMLLEAGLQTPRPLLMLEKKKFGLLCRSYLLVEYIDGAVQLREILTHFRKAHTDWQGIEKFDFLAQLAEYVGTMHRAGICHRDLSGGNVLVKVMEGKPIFELIDINRCRIRNPITPSMRLKDLERIHIVPEEREFFLEKYCGNKELFDLLKDDYLRRIDKYRTKRERK